MVYTSDFITVVADKLRKAGTSTCQACKGTGKVAGSVCSECKGAGLVPSGFRKRYRVEVELKMPPLIECMRAMDEAKRNNGDLSIDLMDKILHYSIIGRPVKAFYDDVEIVSFVINNMNEPWDNHSQLVEHQQVLGLLYEMATSNIMLKWLPPPASTPQTAANAIGGSKRS